jgi:hypothetical protein
MRSKYRHFVGCTHKGWAWLTCVRFRIRPSKGCLRVPRGDGGFDGRYAVVTDACDEQSYAMFDAMRGTATARPGIQSPLY